ncbi:MAG: DNA polymerase III subunit gamma/tau, partial [Planctomycetota bacterium]
MSYVVFARKYRPQTFDELVGQEHVAATLRNALRSGRVVHAYLFCGPRGVGKTTMARLLAKSVNCLASPGPDPCGACDACKGIAAGGDIDVLEIDAASNRKVEEVEPIIDAARYVPQRSPRKIFIVDEAHMLSTTAFNALLKTLEEPPPHVLFILATTEPHKIPETVRSRCQRHDFRRIPPSGIVGKLKRIARSEAVEVEEEVLQEIARRATGGLRDAESLFDQALTTAPQGRPLAARDLVAVLGETPRELRAAMLKEARD